MVSARGAEHKHPHKVPILSPRQKGCVDCNENNLRKHADNGSLTNSGELSIVTKSTNEV